MLSIHFGMSGCSPGTGRLRQFRTASASISAPRTILPQEMVSEAPLLVEGSPASAAK